MSWLVVDSRAFVLQSIPVVPSCVVIFEDMGQESAYAEYFLRAGIPLAKRWCEKRGFPIANEGAG